MLIRSEKTTTKSTSSSFAARQVPVVRQRERPTSAQQSHAILLQSRNVKPILLLTITLCLCLALRSKAQQAEPKLPSTSQQQQHVSKTINNSEIRIAEEDRRRIRSLEPRSQRPPARASLAANDNDDALDDDRSVLSALPERTHISRRNAGESNSPAASSPSVDKSTAAEEPAENGGSGGGGESGDADYESSANGDDANGSSSTGSSGVDYAGDATDSSPDAEEQPAVSTPTTNAIGMVRPSRQSDSSSTSSSPPPPVSRLVGASQRAPQTTSSPRANDISLALTTNTVQPTTRLPSRAPQQQAAAGERMLQPVAATTTTSSNNNNFAGRTPPTLLQNQLQLLSNPGGQQRAASTAAPPPPTTRKFGADQIVIRKSHPMLTPPPLPSVPTTSSSDLQETSMATESVLHELLVGGQQAPNGQHAGANPSLIHERRQDLLLYPSNQLNGEDSMITASHSDPNGQPQVAGANQANSGEQQQQQEQAAVASQMSSVCHTPFALFAIIILTMLTTMFVCFCTHALFKHFGRHQFDLIATSKQYNGSPNYESGYLAAAALERQANYCSPHQQTSGGKNNNQQQVDLTGLGKNSCMLSIFGQQQQNGRLARDEHGCAFENPYFTDESSSNAAKDEKSSQSYQQRRQQQQEQQFQLARQAANGRPSSTNLLATSNRVGSPQTGAAATILREPPNTEQLHFIEHHISNLHNRQVTSSVKELSILGNSLNSNGAATQAVATSGRQAKSAADLREGDLIAVDITGHDFIGLGFGVCGNERDGIFVESVLSRGPAKESGCIEQGDRIKGLNISFDAITLQDAYDLLNCASPYKMRLLLEKQALCGGASDKMSKQQRHLQQQPVYKQQLLVNRLSAPPSSSMLLKHNQSAPSQQSLPRSVLSQQQLTQGSPGAILDSPLSVTKSYIRRLTNLVSMSNSNQAANEDQPLEQQPPVYLLGSAAARNRYHSRASSSGPFVESRAGPAHANAGYKTDDDDDDDHGGDDDERIESATATISDTGRGRQHSLNADSLSSQTEGLSSSCNKQSNGAGQASSTGSSLEIFQTKASLNESGPDSSLDYQSRNANHRLHGPQLNGSRSKKNKSLGGTRDVVELNLSRRQSALAESTSSRAPAISSGVSLASEQPSTLHLRHNRLMMNNSLEQTQSQPEICVAFRDEHQLEEHQSRPQQALSDAKLITNSELAPVTLKNGDRSCAGANKNTRNQKLMNSRLGQSVSTPTMNVGSTFHMGPEGNHLQDQSQLSSADASVLVAGPLRASSSRRVKKALTKRESIKEETHLVESDGEEHSSSSKKSPPQQQHFADDDYSTKAAANNN